MALCTAFEVQEDTNVRWYHGTKHNAIDARLVSRPSQI